MSTPPFRQIESMFEDIIPSDGTKCVLVSIVWALLNGESWVLAFKEALTIHMESCSDCSALLKTEFNQNDCTLEQTCNDAYVLSTKVLSRTPDCSSELEDRLRQVEGYRAKGDFWSACQYSIEAMREHSYASVFYRMLAHIVYDSHGAISARACRSFFVREHLPLGQQNYFEGALLLRRGYLDVALLKLTRALKQDPGNMYALNSIGLIELLLGDKVKSRSIFRICVKVFRRRRDKKGELIAMRNLWYCSLRRRRTRSGNSTLKAHLHLLNKAKCQWLLSEHTRILCDTGEMLLVECKPKHARMILDLALNQAQNTHNKQVQIFAQFNLGLLFAIKGSFFKSKTYLMGARAVAQACEDTYWDIECQRMLHAINNISCSLGKDIYNLDHRSTSLDRRQQRAVAAKCLARVIGSLVAEKKLVDVVLLIGDALCKEQRLDCNQTIAMDPIIEDYFARFGNYLPSISVLRKELQKRFGGLGILIAMFKSRNHTTSSGTDVINSKQLLDVLYAMPIETSHSQSDISTITTRRERPFSSQATQL